MHVAHGSQWYLYLCVVHVTMETVVSGNCIRRHAPACVDAANDKNSLLYLLAECPSFGWVPRLRFVI